jgi:hypothetical protein
MLMESAMAQPVLAPVAVKNLDASTFGDQAVYADATRIYVASDQGQLLVLERNRSTGFPIVKTFSVGVPLTAVRGDATNIYVTAADGKLRTYKKSTLKLSRTTTVSTTLGLRSLAVVGNYVYVAVGQGEVEADSGKVYFSAADFGDQAVEVRIGGNPTGKVYQTSLFMTTVVFNRSTAATVGTIGNAGGQMAMKLGGGSLYQAMSPAFTTANGFWVYDKVTLAQTDHWGWPGLGTIVPVAFQSKSYLVYGDEAGRLGMMDLTDLVNGPFISLLNLSGYTGFIGDGDIQLRSIWADGLDGLIFASSTWNNNPAAPSFFVVEPTMP